MHDRRIWWIHPEAGDIYDNDPKFEDVVKVAEIFEGEDVDGKGLSGYNHPENLQVGDYIIVVEDREWDPIDTTKFPHRSNPPIAYHGIPYRIMAVSYPMIAVDVGGAVQTVDLRRYNVRTVTQEYFDCFKDIEDGDDYKFNVPEELKEEEDREDPQRGLCPVCISKMSEFKPAGEDTWGLRCRECGFEGKVMQRN